MIRLFLFLFFISSFASVAQPWPFISGVGIFNSQSRSYGAVEVTGGYLVAGWSGLNPTGMDATLMKLEPSGDTMWVKHYGGNAPDAGRSLVASSDGYFAIAGNTASFGEGADDMLLIKVDQNGDTLFTRCYGGPLSDAAWNIRSIQYGAPGYILCGHTQSYGAGLKDIYLARTDLNGSLLWTRSYGGVKNEEAYDVVETNDKGFALTGYIESLGADSSDLFVLKTDSTGNFEWMKRFGNNYDDYGRGIFQTADSALIVAGYGKTGSIYEDSWMFKLSIDGNNMIWGKSYGGVQFDSFYDVIALNDGGILAGGYTNCFGAGGQDAFIIRTDANGDTLWTRTFGGPGCEEIYGMLETSNSGFILASYEQSFDPMTQLSWLIKTDSNGFGPGCHENGAAPVISVLNISENFITPFITLNNGVEGITKFGINRGDHLDRFCSPGGLNDEPKQHSLVFPVPATDHCTVIFSLPVSETSIFDIVDMSGRILQSLILEAGITELQIDLKPFSDGVLFLKNRTSHYPAPVRIILIK